MTDNTFRTVVRISQVAVGLLVLATFAGAGYYITTENPELGFFYLALGVINLFNFGVITNALQDL